MSRRNGLGRGLGALIPSDLSGDENVALRELPLNAVEPNRYQPREHFDEASLVALSDSIRELGVLQPILVRPVEGTTDRFELIAGERRWRAARKAGLPTIPAIVRTIADSTSLEQALVENIHRAELNPLEEGAAYQQLMEDFGLTQEQVAARVGKSRSAVANTMRLLQLPASTQRLVAEGRLTAGHARALLATPDRSLQDELARRVVSENLSVRQIEDAVRFANERQSALLDPTPPQSSTAVDAVVAAVASSSGSTAGTGAGATPGSDAPIPHSPAQVPTSVVHAGAVGTAAPAERSLPAAGLLELEQLLGDFFETSVRINAGRGRGRITIDFADVEDLERIYRLIVEGP